MCQLDWRFWDASLWDSNNFLLSVLQTPHRLIKSDRYGPLPFLTSSSLPSASNRSSKLVETRKADSQRINDIPTIGISMNPRSDFWLAARSRLYAKATEQTQPVLPLFQGFLFVFLLRAFRNRCRTLRSLSLSTHHQFTPSFRDLNRSRIRSPIRYLP